ncbi:MAG: hypothetical protein ACE366_11650 [Bradymonadia bacterium]
MRLNTSHLLLALTSLVVPALAWAGGGGGPPGGGGGGGAPEPGMWAMMLAGSVPATWAVRSALKRRALEDAQAER